MFLHCAIGGDFTTTKITSSVTTAVYPILLKICRESETFYSFYCNITEAVKTGAMKLRKNLDNDFWEQCLKSCLMEYRSERYTRKGGVAKLNWVRH